MSIVVTATSGNLGRLVVKDLLNRGVLPPRSSRLHDRPTQSRTSQTLGCAHAVTEAAVRDSGIPFTLLRNGWYTESYGRNLPTVRTTGPLLASVGDARVASTSRQDFAQAVGAVVTTDGHLGKTYELAERGGEVVIVPRDVTGQVTVACMISTVGEGLQRCSGVTDW